MRLFWVLCCAFVVLLVACTPSEGSIKAEIEKANYCATADDCELAAFSKCPFGCYVYVNKVEANRIVSLIDSYERMPRGYGCAYMCVRIEGVDCQDGKCVPLPERPAPDECVSDSDCVPAQCCHATSCVPKAQAPNCEGTFCTMECRSGTIDCGGGCACEGKKCVARLAP
jgi:hypothetical protein